MKSLNKIGGVLMLISLFLPLIYRYEVDIVEDITFIQYMWLFGLILNHATGSGWYVSFFPLALPFFAVILVFSILCIKKEAGDTKIFGILAPIIAFAYYLIILAIIGMWAFSGGYIEYIVPYIGFFGILIGGILNVIAK